jgi:hypothetical protein
MDIKVEYFDQNGLCSNLTESINIFGLLKHLAIAGQGYLPSLKYYIKMVGIFCRFIEYLDRNALINSYFSEPPNIRRDPTEKANFSTLAGKGIADFLAKKLSNAKITHNYEAAMTIAGYKIKGSRPDLYCIGNNFQFALEAKGSASHSISANEMLIHKNQSMNGPLPVNFTVASVSFRLYKDVHCNYHDPYKSNIKYNFKLNSRLNTQYYKGVFEYLDHKYFNIEEGEIEGNHCFFIDILGYKTPIKLLIGGRSFTLILQSEFKKIISGEKAKFNESIIQGKDYYLDTDGIGFCLRNFKYDNIV